MFSVYFFYFDIAVAQNVNIHNIFIIHIVPEQFFHVFWIFDTFYGKCMIPVFLNSKKNKSQENLEYMGLYKTNLETLFFVFAKYQYRFG